MHVSSLIDDWNHDHSPELERTLRRLTGWADRSEMMGLIRSASAHPHITHAVQLLEAALRHRLAAIQDLCTVGAALDRKGEAGRALADNAHRRVGGLGGARSGGRPSPRRSRRRPGWRSSLARVRPRCKRLEPVNRSCGLET